MSRLALNVPSMDCPARHREGELSRTSPLYITVDSAYTSSHLFSLPTGNAQVVVKFSYTYTPTYLLEQIMIIDMDKSFGFSFSMGVDVWWPATSLKWSLLVGVAFKSNTVTIKLGLKEDN